MKKIGLITIYHVPNFGSVLQAYATQVLIEKEGFKCDILNYKYPNKWHYDQNPSLNKKISRFKSYVGYLLGLTSHHRKEKKLELFKKKNYHYTRRYNSLDELHEENWQNYSAFVVGSDQVWKPQYTLGDSAFLLSFIPDEKFRFSFASSFATKKLPEIYKKKYRKYLSKFSYLSTREQNGKDVIEDLGLDMNVQVILDPTLLLDKFEWLDLLPTSNFRTKNKYILLYLLTYAFEPRPYVFDLLKYLKKKYGYEIIALEGYESEKNAEGLQMIDKTDSSITQFMDLFNHAEMVVTTSFHGTAFALNFLKPLISIVPDNVEDDRQTSLLRQLGLEQCITHIGTSFENINPQYDELVMLNHLNKLRSESKRWLSQVLQKI